MNVTFDQFGDEARDDAAVVFVVSDSLGESANNVVLSAAAQFSDGAVRVVRLSQIESVEDVSKYLDEHEEEYVSTAVFHSIVDPMLRRRVRNDLNARGILSVDILGPVVQLLAGLTEEKPKNQARAHHTVDARYKRRVDAMEFIFNHDDGKNSQDLPEADVILVGLTGSAKTPLAMHLSFLGYKVANLPLDPGVELPEELSEVDHKRVFGLVNSLDALVEARLRSAADKDANEVMAEVEEAQVYAIKRMDDLGCVCLNTEHKTVEELGADIIARIESI